MTGTLATDTRGMEQHAVTSDRTRPVLAGATVTTAPSMTSTMGPVRMLDAKTRIGSTTAAHLGARTKTSSTTETNRRQARPVPREDADASPGARRTEDFQRRRGRSCTSGCRALRSIVAGRGIDPVCGRATPPQMGSDSGLWVATSGTGYTDRPPASVRRPEVRRRPTAARR
jgi:hypothetical protein